MTQEQKTNESINKRGKRKMAKSCKISHIVNYPCEFSNLKFLSFPKVKNDAEPSTLQRQVEAKKQELQNIFLTSLESSKKQNEKSAADQMSRLNIKRGIK